MNVSMSKKIGEFLHSIVPAEVAWKLTLLKAWPDIVGKLAERVSIFSIDADRLILQTSHPAWAQELNFLTPLIHEKIDALVGPEIIRSISFKIIKRRAVQTTASFPRNDHSLHSIKHPPYAMSKQEVAKLETLKDEQLREALRDYLLRTKARI